ncbi:MAG: BlaI/MecI/CopY family transcriptional regulator, partial [Caulobacteraceae bacterium]
SPLVSRQSYVQFESQGLLDRLFDGKLAPLVTHFSDADKLSDEDIAELKALIERIGK